MTTNPSVNILVTVRCLGSEGAAIGNILLYCTYINEVDLYTMTVPITSLVHFSVCVCVCVCACVHTCVRACVRACVNMSFVTRICRICMYMNYNTYMCYTWSLMYVYAYVSRLVIPSLKIKGTDWSTFAMYWGTTLTLLVMYPGFVTRIN